MNILFVCQWNRFRSKVAETFFNKYNKNPNAKARSAGASLDFVNPMVSQNVKKELANRGLKVVDEHSQPINQVWTDWAEKIIIVADDVDPNNSAIFPENKNVEVWPVKDATDTDIEGIRKGIIEIEGRVKKYVKDIQFEA